MGHQGLAIVFIALIAICPHGPIEGQESAATVGY